MQWDCILFIFWMLAGLLQYCFSAFLELPSFIMSSLDFLLNLHCYSLVGMRVQAPHQAFPDALWLGGENQQYCFSHGPHRQAERHTTTTDDWELKSWVSRERRTVPFHDKGMVEIQSACWSTPWGKAQIRGKAKKFQPSINGWGIRVAITT